jgi:CHAT domain-containing protein/tetratricopeptide (TPR) repeat protein
MITLLAALALVTPTTGGAQDPQHVDELRALARKGPDSALIERARQRPNDAREALRQLLAVGGREDSAGAAARAAAERLAGAFAVASRDSFLLRQVTRFQSLSPADRQATVAGDSISLVAIAAIRRFGTDSAIPAWRESLRRFEALADSAGIASTLNRLGAGFYYAQEYDSAETYLALALDQAERIGDQHTTAKALGNLGAASERRGDLRRASELYARAKPIYERLGDAVGLAMNENNRAVVAQTMGDLAGARRSFESSLAASRSAGEPEEAARTLSNLGNLALEEGAYAEAAARFRDALSIYRKRGNQVDVVLVLYNLGVLATRRADYSAALAAFSEAAAILARTGPSPSVNEIDVRVELAGVRARMGDLQGARTELERAEALASRRSGGGASLGSLALARGDLALTFNHLPDAKQQYDRADRLARGTTYEEIDARNRAQIGMAVVFFKRERYHRAQLVLEQLLQKHSLDRHTTAQARLLMGEAAWRDGNTAAARRAFGQALDTLGALGAVADQAEALGKLGDLEAGARQPLAAESLYRRGLTRLGALRAPAVAWPLHAGLAATLRSRGALDDAAQELLAGIGEIERVSGTLQLEEHRAAFLEDKWQLYVELALVERARGRTEAAFGASERLRARQMLDLLARGRVGEPEPARELSTKEQDLRHRMRELALQVEGPPRGDVGAEDALRDRAPVEAKPGPTAEALAQVQESYGHLLLEIRGSNPSYAAMVRGETVGARAVMTTLAPEEALLEYLVGDSTTIVFVVTADTLAALDLKVSHDALAAQVDFARSTLASPTEGAARRAWRPPLRRLYRQLVEPVEATGLLAGKRRLLIAPHAELHYLPFAALVRPGPPEQLLIEQYLIEYVPSASVWLRLRGRPEPARGGGILALAPRPAALPGSRAEVAAIRRTYGGRARTLVGTAATERAFRALAPEQEIVHLATYGVLNKHNPLFSFVEMGAGGGEDGRLEVHEVFGLTLNARLLVLSACQTGLAAGALADVPPGDDWVGLVQGFLYAGASNVMATLWPVAEVATARLMERFYGELATGRPEVEALAVAQRAAVREPATAHPFFWAGFALVRGR